MLVARAETPEHGGRARPAAPGGLATSRCSTPTVLRLARAVADRYAGSLSDVLRLAVPPRHAGAERTRWPTPARTRPGCRRRSGAVGALPGRPGLRGPAGRRGSPRAVWTALPGPDWAAALAVAAAATLASGRGALLVLPDRRDVDAVEAASARCSGRAGTPGSRPTLGAAPRYAAFLALRRGEVRLAIGTRAAAFAPVADLGLVVVWDDGDDQHAEPRAPYPHARDVLALRAEQAGAALLVGGWSRTAETEAAAAGRLGPADRGGPGRPPRTPGRGSWSPARRPMPPGTTRTPRPPGCRATPGGRSTTGWPAARCCPGAAHGLRAGAGLPVRCRHAARCPHCAGPLELPGQAGDVALPPQCGWCGRAQPAWRCPSCGSRGLRAVAIGVERTAEELGRAFPGARVVVSRPVRKLPKVPPRQAVVLATPGIEPVAAGRLRRRRPARR